MGPSKFEGPILLLTASARPAVQGLSQVQKGNIGEESNVLLQRKTSDLKVAWNNLEQL